MLRFTCLTILLLTAWSIPLAEQTTESPDTESTTITLAGGCFWCLEADYDKIKGVLKTTSGYAGGRIKNPSYNQVASGRTTHIEVVQIEYNPKTISYRELVDLFWTKVDPTDAGGQFCDRGPQYRTAIFPQNEQQLADAKQSLQALVNSAKLKDPIVTEIIPDAQFYLAERYHQDYYTKNPIRYKFYRYRCGRDRRLEELWNKPSTEM